MEITRGEAAYEVVSVSHPPFPPLPAIFCMVYRHIVENNCRKYKGKATMAVAQMKSNRLLRIGKANGIDFQFSHHEAPQAVPVSVPIPIPILERMRVVIVVAIVIAVRLTGRILNHN